jgi:hypothetical protein
MNKREKKFADKNTESTFHLSLNLDSLPGFLNSSQPIEVIISDDDENDNDVVIQEVKEPVGKRIDQIER